MNTIISPKTALLIHGFHLQAENWEDIVWGDPKNGRLGVAAKGILEALKWNAAVVIMGTGASQRDDISEAEYTYAYALDHLDDVAELAGMPVHDIRKWLDARVHLDLVSNNTTEEIQAAAMFAREAGAEQLVIVSIPTHTSRSHRIALSILGSDPRLHFLLKRLYATSSDVPYAHTTVDDVVIIEPPHRPDRPSVPFAKTVKGILPFRITDKVEVARDFNEALIQLIEEWKQKL